MPELSRRDVIVLAIGGIGVGAGARHASDAGGGEMLPVVGGGGEYAESFEGDRGSVIVASDLSAAIAEAAVYPALAVTEVGNRYVLESSANTGRISMSGVDILTDVADRAEAEAETDTFPTLAFCRDGNSYLIEE